MYCPNRCRNGQDPQIISLEFEVEVPVREARSSSMPNMARGRGHGVAVRVRGVHGRAALTSPFEDQRIYGLAPYLGCTVRIR